MVKANLLEENLQGQSLRSQGDTFICATNGAQQIKNVPFCLTEANPSVLRLLDVISSILAEEYIATAKQNPEVFIKNEV